MYAAHVAPGNTPAPGQGHEAADEPARDDLHRLAAGASADVLAIDAHRVLKLFRREMPREAILREVAHARWARLQGLPVAQALDVVEHGDRTGIVFERRDGPTVFTLLCTGEREPAELATLFFRLQQRIHHAPCNLLPPAQPALVRRIAAAAVDDDVKTRALMVAQARSARNGACHGDFHPLNVILWLASPVVVDWMDAGCGDPALDVTRTLLFLLYAHNDTIAADTRDAFVQAYRQQCLQAWGGRAHLLSRWVLPAAVARLVPPGGVQLSLEHPERQALNRVIRGEVAPWD
jgi:Ser/Thr protein kinase RdoA (MazF antagonist)